jgi:hypothetical protein
MTDAMGRLIIWWWRFEWRYGMTGIHFTQKRKS